MTFTPSQDLFECELHPLSWIHFWTHLWDLNGCF